MCKFTAPDQGTFLIGFSRQNYVLCSFPIPAGWYQRDERIIARQWHPRCRFERFHVAQHVLDGYLGPQNSDGDRWIWNGYFNDAHRSYHEDEGYLSSILLY